MARDGETYFFTFDLEDTMAIFKALEFQKNYYLAALNATKRYSGRQIKGFPYVIELYEQEILKIERLHSMLHSALHNEETDEDKETRRQKAQAKLQEEYAKRIHQQKEAERKTREQNIASFREFMVEVLAGNSREDKHNTSTI